MSIQSKLKELSARAEKAVDLVTFSPDDAHRRARSNFWSHFSEPGSLPPDSIDLATALRYSGDSRVSEWWSLPGFQDWFSNRQDFRQKVEVLAELALDELRKLMVDPSINPSARVAALGMVLKLGKKLDSGNTSESTSGDSKIDKMNKAELEEYIRGRLKYIPTVQPVDKPE